MTVKEIMERAGTTQTGRAVAYIKDALEEIELNYPYHLDNLDINIVADQRVYDLPNDMVKLYDVQCKNQNNTNDEFRSIPRLINPPVTQDKD
jgi:hypothetical protein